MNMTVYTPTIFIRMQPKVPKYEETYPKMSSDAIRAIFDTMDVATIGHVFISNKMAWVSIREWKDTENAYALIHDLKTQDKSELIKGFICHTADVDELNYNSIQEHSTFNHMASYYINFNNLDKEIDDLFAEPETIEFEEEDYADWMENELRMMREREEIDKEDDFIMDANYWYETRMENKEKLDSKEFNALYKTQTKLEYKYETFLKTGLTFA